jgi:hypothetical protein
VVLFAQKFVMNSKKNAAHAINKIYVGNTVEEFVFPECRLYVQQ